MKKLLVILGPTATGKTDLAIHLAKKLNGQLIACDSRQIYKGLDIGTGKLPSGDVAFTRHEGYWEIDGQIIWLYDKVDPNTQYTVLDYINDATKVIERITREGKLPILVGGTGLYLKGLIEGFSNLAVPTNLKLREDLEKLTVAQLQKKLETLAHVKFNSLNDSDKKNKRRLLRSIELVIMNPHKETKNKNNYLNDFNILQIGLSASREELNKRIDLRVTSRINQGMIEEAKKLQSEGLSCGRMKDLGLEYRYLSDYLENKISKEQLIDQLKNKIHQYAKRQMTWFKRDKEIEWFDIMSKNFLTKVEKSVLDWYNHHND